jgi:putative aldouronate transport system substrate-binding protein
MKRKLALILAVLLVVALFAGCNNSTNSGTTTPTPTPDNSSSSTPTPQAPENGGGDEPAPIEDEGPYKLAKGKYSVDPEGWPLEQYEYELPLSTTDEVFTNMTLSFTPQYLPEGGMGELPMYAGMEDMTGVHMEYNVIASASFVETLSVMEASDELCDITAGYYAYHQGSSLASAIEEELIINHYDWKEYAPNYCWYANHFKFIDAMWGYVCTPGVDKWSGFVDFYDEPCQTTGYFMRGDWLDQLGLKAEDAITYDDWYDQLKAIQTAGYCEFPLQVYSNIDAYANVWNGFNTSPYSAACTFLRVIDGKVNFNGTTDDDLVLLQYLKKWFDEGIISPYFQSMTDLESITADVTTGSCGCAFFNPSEIAGTESSCEDPNARFDVMRKLVRNKGDILHWHMDPDEFGGTGGSVAARCNNIPLVVTWLDWAYSPTGADWRNYGPEGVYWNYNENGEREWTEIMTSFELGVGWATMAYLQNPMDCGVNAWTRNYKYPGGERLLHFFDVWNEVLDYYDGAYNYPSAIKLTDEESNEVNALRTDANTFFSENYVLFLLGDKSFAEWDSFQQQLGDMGMTEITQIYQDAYDAYIAA